MNKHMIIKPQKKEQANGTRVSRVYIFLSSISVCEGHEYDSGNLLILGECDDVADAINKGKVFLAYTDDSWDRDYNRLRKDAAPIYINPLSIRYFRYESYFSAREEETFTTAGCVRIIQGERDVKTEVVSLVKDMRNRSGEGKKRAREEIEEIMAKDKKAVPVLIKIIGGNDALAAMYAYKILLKMQARSPYNIREVNPELISNMRRDISRNMSRNMRKKYQKDWEDWWLENGDSWDWGEA